MACVGQVRDSREVEPGVELSGGVIDLEGVEPDLMSLRPRAT
jgi:hypothetical protein